MSSEVVQQTGALFGDLWHRYDDKLFAESVALFSMRFQANGFPLEWFRGKRCLDAGCGGGRYTLAMGELGAAEAIGCDISERGLEDATRRAEKAGRTNVRFQRASVLELPFPDASFDFVCSSGVLHHTTDPYGGLRELVRVLRPGGRMFTLWYGAGGVRWPAMLRTRPHAAKLGYEALDRAMKQAELPANKQRTFLDDLFVPEINFYGWAELRAELERAGLTSLERWEKGKLDHEASVPVQREELHQLRSVFALLAAAGSALPAVGAAAVAEVDAALAELEAAEASCGVGLIDARRRDERVFGEGHHRVLGTKR